MAKKLTVKQRNSYLKNQSQIKNIQWDQNHLWDIKFENCPHPFNEWTPAIDFNLNYFNASSYTLSATTMDFSVPVGSSSSSLSMTVVDTDNRIFWNWMKDWYDFVYNDPRGLATVYEASRKLFIAKLNPEGNIISAPETLLVYPDGGISWSGGSDSSITTTPFEFVVVSRS
jgi:hypothetical protein